MANLNVNYAQYAKGTLAVQSSTDQQKNKVNHKKEFHIEF